MMMLAAQSPEFGRMQNWHLVPNANAGLTENTAPPSSFT
jgi:hypothetical protein